MLCHVIINLTHIQLHYIKLQVGGIFFPALSYLRLSKALTGLLNPFRKAKFKNFNSENFRDEPFAFILFNFIFPAEFSTLQFLPIGIIFFWKYSSLAYLVINCFKSVMDKVKVLEPVKCLSSVGFRWFEMKAVFKTVKIKLFFRTVIRKQPGHCDWCR